MRKFIISLLFLCVAESSFSGQWVALSAADIDTIQILQGGNSAGNLEGLYIALKVDISGEVASYCSRKNFIAIIDPKLIDRTYSGLMYAISTQKTFQLYADGAGKCISNGPQATAFLLKP